MMNENNPVHSVTNSTEFLSGHDIETSVAVYEQWSYGLNGVRITPRLEYVAACDSCEWEHRAATKQNAHKVARDHLKMRVFTSAVIDYTDAVRDA